MIAKPLLRFGFRIKSKQRQKNKKQGETKAALQSACGGQASGRSA